MFRTSSSEDRDFCSRFRAMGYKIRFEPNAVIYHAHELNFKSFFLQHFRYGRGASLYQSKQKHRGSGSLTNDISFHLNFGNYVFYPFTKVNYSKYPQLAILLLIWQFANSTGYLWENVFGD